MLLRGVRAVAAHANPDEPEGVSQSAFDAARQRCPDRYPLPRAKRITERLGLPWRDVLALAHAPNSAQNRLLGLGVRESAAEWLTRDCVRSALRVVALRRRADTLTLAEYRVERAAMLAADHSRWMHGGTLRMPTDEQIIAVAGSWEAALRFAGLRAPGDRNPAEGRHDAAPPLVDLLARFHDAHNYQPSARDLRAFARANGIPYPSERTQRFSAAIAQWAQQRREHGLPEPRAVQRTGGRGRKAPAHDADTGAALASEQRRKRWTRAECVAAVSRYHAQLRPRERSTQRGYTDWAATQPRGTTPALATVQEHGGWERVRRDAIARNAQATQHPA